MQSASVNLNIFTNDFAINFMEPCSLTTPRSIARKIVFKIPEIDDKQSKKIASRSNWSTYARNTRGDINGSQKVVLIKHSLIHINNTVPHGIRQVELYDDVTPRGHVKLFPISESI